MAKIIKDTKQITEYSGDYRSGGRVTYTVEAYYCGNCKKELSASNVKFCNHCGSPLRGVQNEIEKRRKKIAKPYEDAYNKIMTFRNTFDKESLEYRFLSNALIDLNKEKYYVEDRA
jgi:predicted amidophosphoribosyltransferase